MTNIEVKEQDLLALVKELKEKVQAGTDRETVRTMVEEAVEKAVAPLRTRRKGEYQTAEAANVTYGHGWNPGHGAEMPEELLHKADDIYILSKVCAVHPTGLKSWQSFTQEMSEFHKALDTATAGEGAEWLPTGFSKQLIDSVRLKLKVAALHQRISMPTNPYRLPVEGADAVAYLSTEATSDTPSKLTASTPGTANITLDAVKLAVRVLASGEVTEDSIVPILPFIRNKIVRALSDAQENATINGDDSGTHQDSDVTSAEDARKAFKGYRKLSDSSNNVDLSTFNISGLRTVRKNMAKYGVNPSDLAWVCGISIFNKMLSLDEVITVDKYGPAATILQGELAKLDGIPVIISEFVREDLNASGVYDGVTTDKTIVILAHRGSFIYGDRREVTLKGKEDIETDQQVTVATQRLDFKSLFDATSEPIVVVGYNVAS